MFRSNNNVFSSIQFDILSKEDILAMSVVEVKSSKLNGANSVYDEKMGPLIITKDICATCGLTGKNCSGHFGHINLAYPIFHPLFDTEIITLIKMICFNCNHVIVDENETVTSKNRNICLFCNVKQPNWEIDDTQKQSDVFYSIFMSFVNADGTINKVECTASDILNMFENIPKEDLHKCKISCLPQNLIITVLPVLPPSTRPVVILEEKFCDDDLTIQYIEIIKTNNIIYQKIQENNQVDIEKYLKILYFRIASLFNNSSGKSKHNTNGKPIKSIKERLSSKEGVIRGHLMGKRTEQSARTVIGPDPTLCMDEIAIPEEFAETLTISERVNQYNIDMLTKLVNDGKAKFIKKPNGNEINLYYASMKRGTQLQHGDIIVRNGKELLYDRNCKLLSTDYIIRNNQLISIEHEQKKNIVIEIGDIIDRCLKDGDYILLNRQPTLHFGSMIAQKVKIVKGKTLRFNLCITKSLNADFDGDEGNIHVAQKPNTIVELQEISSVKNHIINQKNGSTNTVLVQDNLTSLYLMSIEKTPVNMERLFDICMELIDIEGKPLSMEKINNKLKKMGFDRFINSSIQSDKLISLCLPDTLTIDKENCNIKSGIWISGIFNKKIMSDLIETVYHVYTPEITMCMINNMGFISNKWLYSRGFSIGLEDCLTNSNSIDMIPETITRCFTEANQLKDQIYHDGIREVRIQGSLNKARDIGLRIAKDGLNPKNNFLSTVNSGSKGDIFNIAQIAGLLGQQNFRGKRIGNLLNHKQRSLYHYPFVLNNDKDVYESRGFIRHSFLRGLNPREAYFHALPGREGITDTALGTGSTGYMQRRLIKMMEDVHIANDGTVRDDLNKIYQFYYGKYSFDTTGIPKIEDIVTEINESL